MTEIVEDAVSIWQAGVDAVSSQRLTATAIEYSDQCLRIGSQQYSLTPASHIYVIGAGKAGSGMAIGVLQALQHSNLPISGWINVPADCVQPLPGITLHAARPAGLNEPTLEGVRGTNEIIQILQHAQPDDVCLCLISGGGSALLPFPVSGITLEDKQQITRMLSAAGGNIEQLNSVRKKLSQVKGGGLVQYGRQTRLATLIISDVLGDPLDIIASGPTVPDPTPVTRAIETIHALLDPDHPVVSRCLEVLNSLPNSEHTFEHCHTEIIGNNRTAVEAAVRKAEQLGYVTESLAHNSLEGYAEDIGADHAQRLRDMKKLGGKRVYISGGEPVVKLADERIRGKGGRNQQLVLAALIDQLAHSADPFRCMDQAVILSGGTDGEDGPTPAAGAFADKRLVTQLLHHKLDTVDFLRRNDAYTFFDTLDSLILTGPTHTNVCDLRVLLVDTSRH